MASCSNDDNSQNAVYLENQIYINYKNSNGDNLLNSASQGAYNVENMKLFYLIDDEPVEALIVDPYNSGGIELTPNNELVIFTNVSMSKIVEETEEYKIVENTAYLQLSETDTDTIRTYSQKGYNYYRTNKIWYNNKLVWERETGGIIEIVK